MQTPVPPTLVPVAVAGWTLFAAGPDHWMRDLDLAERADLAQGRDIRRTIKTALEDGALSIAGIAPDTNQAAPAVRIERELVPVGDRGGQREVETYYLSEEAALVVVTRLRTPAAITLTREVVRAFVLVARGALPSAVASPTLTRRAAITFLVSEAMAEGKDNAAVALLNGFRCLEKGQLPLVDVGPATRERTPPKPADLTPYKERVLAAMIKARRPLKTEELVTLAGGKTVWARAAVSELVREGKLIRSENPVRVTRAPTAEVLQ